VMADRFYPSTQICSCCGCLTGPKGREGLSVERWVCSQCGAKHERDANAAINLRKLGLAKPLVNARGHEASSGCVSIPASVVDEPRTETVLTIEHIEESSTSRARFPPAMPANPYTGADKLKKPPPWRGRVPMARNGRRPSGPIEAPGGCSPRLGSGRSLVPA
jgi:hypothetical protein